MQDHVYNAAKCKKVRICQDNSESICSKGICERSTTGSDWSKKVQRKPGQATTKSDNDTWTSTNLTVERHLLHLAYPNWYSFCYGFIIAGQFFTHPGTQALKLAGDSGMPWSWFQSKPRKGVAHWARSEERRWAIHLTWVPGSCPGSTDLVTVAGFESHNRSQ